MEPSVIILRAETALPIELLTALAKDVPHLLAEITAEMDEKIDRGKVADYIPELAAIKNRQFGIAVALRDGSIHTSGNAMPCRPSQFRVFQRYLRLVRLQWLNRLHFPK